MGANKELTPDLLYQACDPESFDFADTGELPVDTVAVGQDRAISAIRFGIGIEHVGYNLYALGPTGTGKQHLVEHELGIKAATRPPAHSLCYVYNFETPTQPRALHLEPGQASSLKGDMARLVDDVTNALQATFESEEYQARLQALRDDVKEQSESRFEALRERAQEKGFAMLSTPGRHGVRTGT